MVNARRVKKKKGRKEERKKKKEKESHFIIGWSGSRRVPKGGLRA